MPQPDLIAHLQQTNGGLAGHDLTQHLSAVAALAERFAQPFASGPWATAAAWLHDLGKATNAFQSYSGLARANHWAMGKAVSARDAQSARDALGTSRPSHSERDGINSR